MRVRQHCDRREYFQDCASTGTTVRLSKSMGALRVLVFSILEHNLRAIEDKPTEFGENFSRHGDGMLASIEANHLV